MPTLKAIVVDDAPSRDKRYHSLFDVYFQLTIKHSCTEFCYDSLRQYDFIILDAFIGDMTAITLINVYKLTEQPILIVSSKWIDDSNGNPTEDLLQYARLPNVISLLSLDGLTKAAANKVYLSFSKYIDVNSNQLSDDAKLTILHISDMQFGGKTSGSASNDYAMISKELTSRLCIPDLIVITGDISNSGKKSEYDDAILWIENLCKKTWNKKILTEEDRKKIIHVPGNHDYDLSLSASCEFKYVFIKDRKGGRKCFKECAHINENQPYGFFNYWDFAYRLTENMNYLHCRDQILTVNSHFVSWNIKFFLMHSAVNIDNQNCEKASLYTDYSHISDEEFLPEDKSKEDCTNILLAHNTPNDFGFMSTEFEKMNNWCKIRNMIENNKIDIMLCGHSHDCNPAFNLGDSYGIYSDKLICTDAPTVRLNAASRAEDATRGFNIILLSRKNGIVKECEVKKFAIEHAKVNERTDKYRKFYLNPISPTS